MVICDLAELLSGSCMGATALTDTATKEIFSLTNMEVGPSYGIVLDRASSLLRVARAINGHDVSWWSSAKKETIVAGGKGIDYTPSRAIVERNCQEAAVS